MRFMMIVKANPDSEAGVMPPREAMEEMERMANEVPGTSVAWSGQSY